MLEEAGKLYLCYYGGAMMNLYDPAKPFWKFGTGADCNPISFGGVGDGHLRPRAMIRGPGGLIYIGSEPPYGQLGGALGVWDPQAEQDHRELPEPRHQPEHRLAGLRAQERPDLRRQRQLGRRRHATDREGGQVLCLRSQAEAQGVRGGARARRGKLSGHGGGRRQGVHHGGRPAVCVRPADDAGGADQHASREPRPRSRWAGIAAGCWSG